MATEPIDYIARTRAYYQALGFKTPYQWAHFDTTPFTEAVPIRSARLALITTAAPIQPGKGDQGPNASYNGAAKFFVPYKASINKRANTGISHIAYDREHSRADDQASWLPQQALLNAVQSDHLGALTPHFYGLPTNRSQRTTLEVDAPAILSMLKADGADVALLVPNCPVCHQCVALTARHLEANGIATVVMACAKDIVEHVGTPRVLFSDFPLGNAAGKPNDAQSQKDTLLQALSLYSVKEGPVLKTNTQTWHDDPTWKNDYSNAALLSEAELRKRRQAFDEQKSISKSV